MSKSIFLFCLFLLLGGASVSADAAQLGRITDQVKFREGPSRSTPVIDILAPGTEVSIRREDPGGWYLVIHRTRPGFVHKSYVKLEQHRNSEIRFDSTVRQFAVPAGMILVSIGVILMVYVFAPFLFKTAMAMVGSLIAVLVFDLAFQLGALYSVFSILLGLLIGILFLSRRKKNRPGSGDEISRPTRKAA